MLGELVAELLDQLLVDERQRTPARDTRRLQELVPPILGVERGWFILSAVTAVSAVNLFAAFWGPALLFAGMYGLGVLAHFRDPQMLKIVAGSAAYKARYDPGKRPPRPRRVELREA